jgi:hypothetical protein
MSTNVLEEHVASVFRFEGKHEASMKQAVSRVYIQEDRTLHLFNLSDTSVTR